MHVCSTNGQLWLAKTLRDDPILVGVLWLALLSFLLIFSYAMLCSLAVLMQFFKQYGLAQKLYRATLNIRQKMPLAGSTARIDVWRISLANCLRLQGNYSEAEELYNTVLGSENQGSALDKLTNYGLKDVARENYAALLEISGRKSEAEEVRANIGKSAALMRLKYLLVSAFVLCVGAGFAYLENAQLADLIH